MTDVRWIDDERSFAELIDRWCAEDRLAIDTEFHRERTYFPRCALVQVGWGDERVLVDPLAVDLAAMAPALVGRTIVMHAAGQDLEVFRRAVGVLPDDLFDTQVAAGFLGMNSIGLAPLVRRLFDADLPKADRLTDWLARPLPQAAQDYAASDVEHLFAIHDLLTADLEARGRLAWVRNECDLMVERAGQDPDPATHWWRVKEARRLRGRAAAIAQEIARWREAQAAESDRPLRSVLPDLALAGMAQRPPRSVDAISDVRGLRDRGLPRALRPGLFAAIEAGQALDLSEVRIPESQPVPAERRPAVPLLMAWVAQRARALDLDPSLLATRGDLEDYLRDDPESRLAEGWRHEAVAADISALLSGSSVLAFDPGEGLVLEPRHPGSDD